MQKDQKQIHIGYLREKKTFVRGVEIRQMCLFKIEHMAIF